MPSPPLWKHHSYPSFYFQTSKYVRQYRVCCLWAIKYVISHRHYRLTCNCTRRIYVIVFWLQKHHLYFWFSILTTRDLFYFLFWVFWRINRYTVPFVCVEKVQKPKHHLSVSTLTSKIIVLSTVFWPFNLKMHQP